MTHWGMVEERLRWVERAQWAVYGGISEVSSENLIKKLCLRVSDFNVYSVDVFIILGPEINQNKDSTEIIC